MIAPSPQSLLKDRFGLENFRPGQTQVIDALLAGRSALALFPTGGGKSLCYQLPALILDGVTLVISPLIALMKDQCDALQALGIHAARIDSSLEAQEEANIHRAMREGQIDLVFVAPERLANEGFRRVLQATPLALVAIDEAHCISEWGHNFRPDYLKLAQLCRTLRVPRVLCLTATATPAVAADIRASFAIADADQIQTGYQRPNLHFATTPCARSERLGILASRLSEGPGSIGSAIVYTTLQRTAEQVAADLRSRGIDARSYHAGMRPEARTEVQDAFMGGNLRVVVATIAFGMGIDKADIRSVFHFNLPKSLENYVQESGRAGRDGQPAHCEILACGDDLTTLENFTWGDTPGPTALRALLDSVLRQGQVFDHSRYHLSASLDMKAPVLATALAWLENQGILELIGPFYGGYRYHFVRDQDHALAGYNKDRRRFLEKVFAAADSKWKWSTLGDVDRIGAEIGEDPQRIRKALRYLADLGEIVLQPNGLRHRYKNLAYRADPSVAPPSSAPSADRQELKPPSELIRELLPALSETFARREQADLKRLAQIVDWCEQPGCLTQQMLKHFGESLPEPCGHCGNCQPAPGQQPKDQITPLPHNRPAELTAEQVEILHNLASENHNALRQARQLARFLAGLTSPATSRARLTRHDSFGALESVPFPLILTQAESLGA